MDWWLKNAKLLFLDRSDLRLIYNKAPVEDHL